MTNQHNSKQVEIPVNSAEEFSFLLTPETVAVVDFLIGEAESAILTTVHDLTTPLEGARQVIYQQGKLAVLRELQLIHSRKLHEESEE